MGRYKIIGELLAPTVGGSMFYCLVSILILVVSTSATLINKLIIPGHYHEQFYQLLNNQITTTFDEFGRFASFGPLSTFLLWAGIGAFLYILLWVGNDFYTMLHNDMVEANFTSFGPTKSRSRLWAEQIPHGLLRLSAVVLLLLFSNAVVQIWYPLSVLMWRISLDNLFAGNGLALLFGALIGWFIALHLSTIFLRIALLRTRVWGG